MKISFMTINRKLKLATLLKILLLTSLIFVITIALGVAINKIWGVEIFIIPPNEILSISSILNYTLIFVSILISNGIFESSQLEEKLNTLLGDSPKLMLEIDKNMVLVPQYHFKIDGSLFDTDKAQVHHQGIIFHYDVLIYNKTLAEACIKEIKLYIGIKKPKVYIAKNFVIETRNGLEQGPEFKQFNILKWKTESTKLAFAPVNQDNVIQLSDYEDDFQTIKFAIEYSDGNKIKTYTKSYYNSVSREFVTNLMNEDRKYTIRKIIGSDFDAFQRRTFTGYNYECFNGINYNHTVSLNE